VEVKIGIQSVPRELVVDTDATAEEIERGLTAALTAADGKTVFALTTQKGGRVLVPVDKIAFVEFGADQARRVGFGNIVLSGSPDPGTSLSPLVPWVASEQLE